MKKAYINPEIKIVKLAMTPNLLAGSMQGNWNTDKSPTNADVPEFFFDDEY